MVMCLVMVGFEGSLKCVDQLFFVVIVLQFSFGFVVCSDSQRLNWLVQFIIWCRIWVLVIGLLLLDMQIVLVFVIRLILVMFLLVRFWVVVVVERMCILCWLSVWVMLVNLFVVCRGECLFGVSIIVLKLLVVVLAVRLDWFFLFGVRVGFLEVCRLISVGVRILLLVLMILLAELRFSFLLIWVISLFLMRMLLGLL